MTRSDREIVVLLHDALAQRVGQARYDLWFGSIAQLSYAKGRVAITVRDEFTRDLVRTQFDGALRDVCADAVGAPVSIEFVVNNNCDGTLAATPSAPASAPPRVQVFDPASSSTSPSSNSPSAAATNAASRPSLPQAPRRRRDIPTFDMLAIGPCNTFAVSSARHVVDRPGECSPLLLCGPTASGKSHLLESIRDAARRRDSRANALLLTAEQFTSAFIESLHQRKLPGFRHKFRGVDFLLLDDIHFLAGKEATLIELQHTLDTLLRAGKQVVLTADRPPRDLADLGKEIVSRTAGGLVCQIEPPGFDVRVEIARLQAKKMGLKLGDGILVAVATHVASNAREIAGAINRLQVTSLALNSPITQELAETTLQELSAYNSPSVGLSDVERAVCDVFGVEPKSLKSKRTAAGLAAGRTLALCLSRRHTRSALSEIGHYYGRKSHSTVITASKRVDGWVRRQAEVQIGDRKCGVEEAIRLIEERLRRA